MDGAVEAASEFFKLPTEAKEKFASDDLRQPSCSQVVGDLKLLTAAATAGKWSSNSCTHCMSALETTWKS
uniref:Uncharacterized protein n=1 Tax=Arundo donax TaxID=35708 RepID=A0A0A8ZVD6_ARUDO